MSAPVWLITTNYPFTYRGGETMFVAPEVERLARSGLQVTVAPLHAVGEALVLPAGVTLDLSLSKCLHAQRGWALGRTLTWPGLARECWRAIRFGGPIGLVRVLRWAAQAQATWQWGQGLPSSWLGYTYWRGGATLGLVRLAQGKPHCAVVSRVHGYELYEERFSPPFQPFVSLYGQLRKVATVSQHGLNYLRDKGVPAERLVRARLGTSAPAGISAASAGQPWRVLSCSNVESLKRLPLLARSLIELAQQHPEQRLVWTHLGDGPDMAALRRQVGQVPANLRVDFPGAVPHEQVMDHFACQPVDVFVLLSRTEGLPVSVQEALSHGVPVVATDVGGTAEAVDAQVGCLLPACPSVQEVTSALASVLWRSTPAQRQSRRMQARERWEQRFQAEVNHSQWATELTKLAAGLHP